MVLNTGCKIDPNIDNLIKNMLQINPEKRDTLSILLKKYFYDVESPVILFSF